MSPLARRLFIALDEWGGILLLLRLHEAGSPLFRPALVTWAVMVYGVSYPWHWLLERREARDRAA